MLAHGVQANALEAFVDLVRIADGVWRSRDDFRTRLDALLDDDHLPVLHRDALKRSIAMEELETSPDERETIVERIEREGHAKGLVAGLEAGLEQGREQGRQEGRRMLLLNQAAVLLPEEYARLATIDDTDALEREVMGLLMRRQ